MKLPLQKKRAVVIGKRGREMEKAEKAKVENLGMEKKGGQKILGHTAEEKCGGCFRDRWRR